MQSVADSMESDIFLVAKLWRTDFTVFVQKLPRGCLIDFSATWLQLIACKSPTLYSGDLGVQPNGHFFVCQIWWKNRRRKLTLQHYFSFHLQLNYNFFLNINWKFAKPFVFLVSNWKAKNKTNTCSFFFLLIWGRQPVELLVLTYVIWAILDDLSALMKRRGAGWVSAESWKSDKF